MRKTQIKKPELRFTVKTWKKFGYEYQKHLLREFDVILTDHKTKTELFFSILRKFNNKNLDLGIKKFNHTIEDFERSMDQLSNDLNKSYGRDTGLKFWSEKKPSFW